jgi:hypothetical protein
MWGLAPSMASRPLTFPLPRLAAHLPPCRVTGDASTADLREANVRALRHAREQHLQQWSEGRGYDLVVVPQVRDYVWGGC